ncbi:hypothetical protein [Streptomyces sp. RP5T]|uniref:hypothetical protein n=1 Tax=Streptomyces sp. RP5T TaxID=2490848 RepID=UPI000F64F6B9|nr:hypothetical protein [Streptomyces sp. RP5T]
MKEGEQPIRAATSLLESCADQHGQDGGEPVVGGAGGGDGGGLLFGALAAVAARVAVLRRVLALAGPGSLCKPTATRMTITGEINLRGLPELLVTEIIFGLQERTRSGAKTKDHSLRPLCDTARRQQVGSITEIDLTGLTRLQCQLVATFTTSIDRLGATPETETPQGRLGPGGLRDGRSPPVQ